MPLYHAPKGLPKVVDASYARHETLFLFRVQMLFYDYFLENSPKDSIGRRCQ